MVDRTNQCLFRPLRLSEFKIVFLKAFLLIYFLTYKIRYAAFQLVCSKSCYCFFPHTAQLCTVAISNTVIFYVLNFLLCFDIINFWHWFLKHFLKTTHLPLNFRIMCLKLFPFCQFYTCSSCTSFLYSVATKLYGLYLK